MVLLLSLWLSYTVALTVYRKSLFPALPTYPLTKAREYIAVHSVVGFIRDLQISSDNIYLAVYGEKVVIVIVRIYET